MSARPVGPGGDVIAASVFRDDSILWDAIIVGSLLLMVAMVVAVFLDMKDGL